MPRALNTSGSATLAVFYPLFASDNVKSVAFRSLSIVFQFILGRPSFFWNSGGWREKTWLMWWIYWRKSLKQSVSIIVLFLKYCRNNFDSNA